MQMVFYYDILFLTVLLHFYLKMFLQLHFIFA